jgi:hypothetical protein
MMELIGRAEERVAIQYEISVWMRRRGLGP